MGIFYFPCNFVYWKNVNNHEKHKNWILDTIKNNEGAFTHHTLLSNGTSTHKPYEYDGVHSINKDLLNNKELMDDVIWKTLDEVINILNSRKNTPNININETFIGNLWLSMYDKNSTVNIHNHYKNDVIRVNNENYKSSFSLIYIIQDPNEKNTTVFIEPNTKGTSLTGMKEIIFNTKNVDEIGEGTVLIFPSSLDHLVDKTILSGRVIMSANLISDIVC